METKVPDTFVLFSNSNSVAFFRVEMYRKFVALGVITPKLLA